MEKQMSWSWKLMSCVTSSYGTYEFTEISNMLCVHAIHVVSLICALSTSQIRVCMCGYKTSVSDVI